MTKEFKIDFRNQFNSIKEGLILFAFTPGALIIAHWRGKITWNDYPEVLLIFFLFNLVFFLPAFFLHVTYYLNNRNTFLIVDTYHRQIKGTYRNSTFNFSIDDIQWAEQHLGIYYKNKHDRLGRWTAYWTGYGYLKLKLKNGQVYFFTSLMLDVQNAPFLISQTKYRFLPFIEMRNASMEYLREVVAKEQQEKFNYYIEKFADLPKEELQEKVDNFKRYEPEAVAACKKLLELEINEANTKKKI